MPTSKFDSTKSVFANPPLYKEALVGLVSGGLLGPVTGWFVGTFATILVAASSDQFRGNARFLRTSAFAGGLVGILMGLVTGILVGLPVRLLFAVAPKTLRHLWAGVAVGSIFGLGTGYLIIQFWYSSPEALVFVAIQSFVVGAAVGGVTVIAKPNWL